MTLLTLDTSIATNPIKVQSSTGVGITSPDLVDDTQASTTFSLSATKTVLVIYQASSNYNAAMHTSGYKSAINVDNTDYSIIGGTGYGTNYSIENTCFWIGSLASGSHTIKGRIATNAVMYETVTVSNRTLLVYIFDGDEFNYIDSTTAQTTTSTSYVNDSYATATRTPSGNCVALALYAVCNNHGVTETTYGKKICIRVGTTDYTACEAQQSNGTANEANSLATAYSLSLDGGTEYTILGRFAANTSATVSVSRHTFCVLFLDSSKATLDLVSSTTQKSTTGTTVVADNVSNYSITRTASGRVLYLTQATTKNGTTGASTYGLRYGIAVDGTDVSFSRTSPCDADYAMSCFSAYGDKYDTSASRTITGRLACNSGTSTAAKVDERILIALWFSEGQEMLTKTFQNTSDIQLQKSFSATNDLKLLKSFSGNSDVKLIKSFSALNDVSLIKPFSIESDIQLNQAFSSSNDLMFLKSFSSSDDILLNSLFQNTSDIQLLKSFSTVSNILLNVQYSNSNDIQLSKTFSSTNDVISYLMALFSSSNNIDIEKVFISTSDICVTITVSSNSDIDLSKAFSSSNAVIEIGQLLTKIFSSTNDIQNIGTWQSTSDIQLQKPFSFYSDVLNNKSFSATNDISISKSFSNSTDIQINIVLSSTSDILVNISFSSSNDIEFTGLLSKIFSSSNDIQTWTTYISTSDIQVKKMFENTNDIIAYLSKLFISNNDINVKNIFSASNDILLSKAFSSFNDIESSEFIYPEYKYPITITIYPVTRTVTIETIIRKITVDDIARNVDSN